MYVETFLPLEISSFDSYSPTALFFFCLTLKCWCYLAPSFSQGFSHLDIDTTQTLRSDLTTLPKLFIQLSAEHVSLGAP